MLRLDTTKQFMTTGAAGEAKTNVAGGSDTGLSEYIFLMEEPLTAVKELTGEEFQVQTEVIWTSVDV